MAPPAAPTISAIDEDTERDAVRLTIVAPAGTTQLKVWRVGTSGTIAGVRAWYPGAAAAGATVVIRDYEAPLDVALTYHVSALNAAGEESVAASATFTLDSLKSDNPWLVDLIRPANSARVTVEALAELDYAVESAVHRILNRHDPVVTSDVAETPEFDFVFVTFEWPGGPDLVRNALGNGVPMLLRTPPEQGVGNLYLQPLGWKESRVSRIAYAPERRHTVHAVQVARPDPALYVPAPPTNYAQVKATYATYAALLAARPTYDSVLYDYASAATAPSVPWPPRDV